jgi:hypothetical protein
MATSSSVRVVTAKSTHFLLMIVLLPAAFMRIDGFAFSLSVALLLFRFMTTPGTIALFSIGLDS